MPPSPTISAEDERALDEAIFALRDEHRTGFGPAMKWLIDHPELSRARVAAIVEKEKSSPADMGVKRAAVVLGEIGHPDDVPVLARALNRGEEVRSWDFAHALAAHRDPAALAALVAATSSENLHIVRAAASGLGARKDEAARPVLEDLLDHESAEVRYTVLHAIIELGAKQSRDALTRRKKVEKDPEVRGLIRKALGS